MCPVGQFDKKIGTDAVGIRKTDGAAESRDDLARDAQPEAGSALLPRVGGLGLCEFLEDARLEILRDARTVIAHPERQAIYAVGILLDGNLDLAAARRKLYRIRQQVGDKLSQPIRVGEHLAGLRFGIETDRGVPSCPRKQRLASMTCSTRVQQLDAPEMELHPTGCHFLDVEHVVDEPYQTLAVVLGDHDEPRGAFSGSWPAAPPASSPSEPAIEVSGVRSS